MNDDRLLVSAALLHGHIGPWLALGLRAGRHAAIKLRAGPFRLRARVWCPGRTPYTCFIDGIQAGSGCTMGKGTIRFHRSRVVRVAFERFAVGQNNPWSAKAEAAIRFRLQPEVWTELHNAPARDEAELEAIARAVYRRPCRSLFLIS